MTTTLDSLSAHRRLNANQQQVQIEQLRNGDRFCVSCGTVCIDAKDPSWKVKCSDCYANKRPAKYCRYDGEELERDRVNAAKMHGGECRQCWSCSKQATKPCETCTVMHPRSWKCSPMTQ